MVTTLWGTTLDSHTLTLYLEAASILNKQCVSSIVMREGEEKMLRQWLVIINLILGPQENHLPMYKMASLVKWRKRSDHVFEHK